VDRKILRADQWERIEQLLPGKVSDQGVTAKDNRRLVEAVLWIMRTGITWREKGVSLLVPIARINETSIGISTAIAIWSSDSSPASNTSDASPPATTSWPSLTCHLFIERVLSSGWLN
jgi:hypothetical protein